MTPEEFTVKLEEMRSIVTEKLAELEENPKWGSAEERDAMINALDEIVLQMEALSAALSEPVENEDFADD